MTMMSIDMKVILQQGTRSQLISYRLKHEHDEANQTSDE